MAPLYNQPTMAPLYNQPTMAPLYNQPTMAPRVLCSEGEGVTDGKCVSCVSNDWSFGCPYDVPYCNKYGGYSICSQCPQFAYVSGYGTCVDVCAPGDKRQVIDSSANHCLHSCLSGYTYEPSEGKCVPQY